MTIVWKKVLFITARNNRVYAHLARHPRALLSSYGSYNTDNPSETRHKSREISFSHNIQSHFPIILKFCTERDSHTAVLCAKFQNDRTSKEEIADIRDFAIFEFETGWICYIVTSRWHQSTHDTRIQPGLLEHCTRHIQRHIKQPIRRCQISMKTSYALR